MGILLKPDMSIKCVFEIWALESLRMTMIVFRAVKKLSSNTGTVFPVCKKYVLSADMLIFNAVIQCNSVFC